MIASLENKLSIQLLVCSRAGARLTPEGEELYPHIQRLRSLAAGLLRDFQKPYPDVEFVLHQGDYTLFQDWLRTGQWILPL